MKHTLSILNHRAGFILSELGTSAKVLEQDGEYTRIEITVNSSFDLLCLFHAGVSAGMN